jgi:hypothetical protein
MALKRMKMIKARFVKCAGIDVAIRVAYSIRIL